MFDSVIETEILHVHLLHEAYFPSVYVALNGNVLLKCLKTSGFFFQGSRCSSDANMLGEMMFGSVAMSYKGSTLKIHQIR